MHAKIKHRILPVLALVCLLAAGAALPSGAALTTGRYLSGTGGSHIVVTQTGSPYIMEDRSSGGRLFAGLQNGDRVLVLHGAAAEVYPARAKAYLCLRLGRGALSDLPSDSLSQLAELGWLPTNVPEPASRSCSAGNPGGVFMPKR